MLLENSVSARFVSEHDFTGRWKTRLEEAF